MGAVDGFGKYAGARGLAYASAAAKQIGVGKSVADDGVFQRHCQRLLPDDAVKP